jgi:3-isopropylmalate dehydrogenase
VKTAFRIALLPGDGIGPEVIAEAVRVLRAVEERTDDLALDMSEFSIGAGEYLRSAQAAERGAEQFRNSSPAAARSESVVREFPGGAQAAERGDKQLRNSSSAAVRSESVVREFPGGAQAAERGAEQFRNSSPAAARSESVVREDLRAGDPLPEHVFAQMAEFDAILLGAMGLPGVRWPDGTEMAPQLDLRERLDLYSGVRPIYLFHAEDSPLRGRQAGDIDFVLLRESTEGLFSTRKAPRNPSGDRATDTMLVTRAGAERIIRAAFRIAAGRKNRVTLVDKANVLPSMAFFRQIFDEISSEFPGIQTDRVYVDAAALYLVQRPQMFDVIVTENMFGDILSDLGAALVGGMGMAPSADIGEKYAIFQPSHGSAPDIAGKGIANPVATILSAAMMLDWLNTGASRLGAAMIQTAVRTVFADPRARTADMGGSLTTSQMGAAILAALPGAIGCAEFFGSMEHDPQGPRPRRPKTV